MTCIVRATSKGAGNSLATLMSKAGIEYRRLKALNKMFIVQGCDENSFPFKESALVESIGGTDVEVKPAGADIYNRTINATEYANSDPNTPTGIGPDAWPAVRISRRENPFKQAHNNQDVSTFLPVTRTGEGVDIYIVDYPVRVTHDEFGGRAYQLDGTQSNVLDSESMTDYAAGDGLAYGHGTMTGSCAAGAKYGVARKATIFNVDVVHGLSWLSVTIETITLALDLALDHYQSRAELNRPAIINLSWTISTQTPESPMVGVVNDIIDAGIVFVKPLGNSGRNLDTDGFNELMEQPGLHDIVGVSGTDIQDRLFKQQEGGTNLGDPQDIFAPGQNMPVATIGTDSEFLYSSGTSFAGPYVAGVIACMLQGHNRLTGRDQVLAVKRKLIANSTKGVVTFPPTYPAAQNTPSPRNRFVYLDPFLEFEEIPGL